MLLCKMVASARIHQLFEAAKNTFLYTRSNYRKLAYDVTHSAPKKGADQKLLCELTNNNIERRKPEL